jgi:hypothetical protein
VGGPPREGFRCDLADSYRAIELQIAALGLIKNRAAACRAAERPSRAMPVAAAPAEMTPKDQAASPEH